MGSTETQQTCCAVNYSPACPSPEVVRGGAKVAGQRLPRLQPAVGLGIVLQAGRVHCERCTVDAGHTSLRRPALLPPPTPPQTACRIGHEEGESHGGCPRQQRGRGDGRRVEGVQGDGACGGRGVMGRGRLGARQAFTSPGRSAAPFKQGLQQLAACFRHVSLPQEHSSAVLRHLTSAEAHEAQLQPLGGGRGHGAAVGQGLEAQRGGGPHPRAAPQQLHQGLRLEALGQGCAC